MKWTVYLFDQKPVSFKKIMTIALLTTTVGAYIIASFIVNLDPSQSSVLSYPFSQAMDIALYIYLFILLIIVFIEIIKISKIKNDDYKKNIEKQFMMITFTKIVSIVMIMGYIVLLSH
jgi:hypothetical protein